MTNLFETKHKDGTLVIVRAKGEKFEVIAGRGNNFFHVITKKTLKGAIGYAKRSCAKE